MFGGIKTAATRLFWATVILCAIGGAALTHKIWADGFHTISQLIGHHVAPHISVKK